MPPSHGTGPTRSGTLSSHRRRGAAPPNDRAGRHGTLVTRMAKNRVFFPQAALDQWISEGKVDLAGDELTIKPDARRYRILEAARVLVECTGLPDANELVGKVKTRLFLSELGAEILESSMVLG